MKNLRRDEKLYIQAFQEIRSYIIKNELKPGDLLPTEQTLCQNLGVSRNVLREAIKSMELMGMIQSCPGRGTQLKEFSMDFLFQNVLFFHVSGEDKPVREMFGIRKMLELGYMRQAFHALKKEDIAHIRECADEIKSRWDNGEMFVEADHEFHMAIFRPLDNGVLNSLLEAIWAVDDGFQLEQKMPYLSSSVNKHDAIVAALENYDYMAFAKAMEAHFSSGKYLTSNTYEEY
ncbi:MAG: FadR family transcriptional regulator [Clostridia bacterium]|nr:FadR family transcriptional regulator [Clostridia bacterium]